MLLRCEARGLEKDPRVREGIRIDGMVAGRWRLCWESRRGGEGDEMVWIAMRSTLHR